MSPERADQVVQAMLKSLDTWYEQALEISDNAHPVTGNKARGLHLARAILSAKQVLERLGQEEDDPL